MIPVDKEPVVKKGITQEEYYRIECAKETKKLKERAAYDAKITE